MYAEIRIDTTNEISLVHNGNQTNFIIVRIDGQNEGDIRKNSVDLLYSLKIRATLVKASVIYAFIQAVTLSVRSIHSQQPLVEFDGIIQLRWELFRE